MVDVDCAVGSAPCLTPAEEAGYEIDEAEVIYWGRCPDCLARTRDRPGIDEKGGPSSLAEKRRKNSDREPTRA